MQDTITFFTLFCPGDQLSQQIAQVSIRMQPTWYLEMGQYWDICSRTLRLVHSSECIFHLHQSYFTRSTFQRGCIGLSENMELETQAGVLLDSAFSFGMFRSWSCPSCGVQKIQLSSVYLFLELSRFVCLLILSIELRYPTGFIYNLQPFYFRPHHIYPQWDLP